MLLSSQTVVALVTGIVMYFIAMLVTGAFEHRVESPDAPPRRPGLLGALLDFFTRRS